jgi:hypothetical protein
MSNSNTELLSAWRHVVRILMAEHDPLVKHRQVNCCLCFVPTDDMLASSSAKAIAICCCRPLVVAGILLSQTQPGLLPGAHCSGQGRPPRQHCWWHSSDCSTHGCWNAAGDAALKARHRVAASAVLCCSPCPLRWRPCQTVCW